MQLRAAPLPTTARGGQGGGRLGLLPGLLRGCGAGLCALVYGFPVNPGTEGRGMRSSVGQGLWRSSLPAWARDETRKPDSVWEPSRAWRPARSPSSLDAALHTQSAQCGASAPAGWRPEGWNEWPAHGAALAILRAAVWTVMNEVASVRFLGNAPGWKGLSKYRRGTGLPAGSLQARVSVPQFPHLYGGTDEEPIP